MSFECEYEALWLRAASVCLREEGIIDGARLPHAGAHRPQRHYNGRRGEGAWQGVASRERAEAGVKIVFSVSTRGVASGYYY